LPHRFMRQWRAVDLLSRLSLESLIERFLNQVSQVFMPRVFECRTTS